MQYEALYERFESLCDKFFDKVDELECVFEETESKSKRLNALKAAFKAFNKCYQIAAPYWFEDYYFMETMEIKEDDPWRTCSDEEVKNMPYNFHSIFCIKRLLKRYEVIKTTINHSL